MMTPVKLATIGIIAAGATFGALTASAAPISSLGSMVQEGSSLAEQVAYRYKCWWDYGHKYCKKVYYRPYARRYNRYNY
jgi:hypothetical protein